MKARQISLMELISTPRVFVVPNFQRAYTWSKMHWDALWNDLIDQYFLVREKRFVRGVQDGHFLGSIVLKMDQDLGDPLPTHWVIDGQQRLITIMTLVAALRDVRARYQPQFHPDAYTNTYLLNLYFPDQRERLIPGSKNHDDFLATVLNNQPRGSVGGCYEFFFRKLEGLAQGSRFSFEAFENALFNRMQLIEMQTEPGDSIHQIFHTINFSGVRLGQLDLIRNHVFMQQDPKSSDEVYASYWAPLEVLFGGNDQRFERYLTLQLSRNSGTVPKGKLYESFVSVIKNRSLLLGGDGDIGHTIMEYLSELRREWQIFSVITGDPAGDLDVFPEKLASLVQVLRVWKSTPTQYVTLDVLCRWRDQRISEEEAERALRYLIGFVTRRALAGIPTNNLSRILSAVVYRIPDGDGYADELASLLSRSPRDWPTNDVVESTAPRVQLNGLSVDQKKILLGAYDMLGAFDLDEFRSTSVVLRRPTSRRGDWGGPSADTPVDAIVLRFWVLGNHALVTRNIADDLPESPERLNQIADSEIGTGITVRIWTPQTVDDASNTIARSALTRFAGPPEAVISNRRGAAPSGSVLGIVDTLLDQSTVATAISLEDLSSISSVPREQIRGYLLDRGFFIVWNSNEPSESGVALSRGGWRRGGHQRDTYGSD
ncbi:DUF262 domain-containing protein [Micrococcus luteus]|uniref:DUF262 domain-containing protein n=1 Tax=Micrococcus luteus TaxID=1270 RepID=UPI0038796B67